MLHTVCSPKLHFEYTAKIIPSYFKANTIFCALQFATLSPLRLKRLFAYLEGIFDLEVGLSLASILCRKMFDFHDATAARDFS